MCDPRPLQPLLAMRWAARRKRRRASLEVFGRRRYARTQSAPVNASSALLDCMESGSGSHPPRSVERPAPLLRTEGACRFAHFSIATVIHWVGTASADTLDAMTKRKGGKSTTSPRLSLDLKQFSSVEDALAKVEPGDRYLDVVKMLLPLEDGMALTLPVMFWFSMITRSQGLHEAIAREIAEQNPHGVFPLIRAFAESVLLVIYVADHPEYVKALIDRPRNLSQDGLRRKTIQALISYARDHAPGMKDVYAELSEATHFGATAMWAAVTPEEEGHFTWASSPRWRSDEQALIACAQTLELADAMTHLLRLFAERHVLPAAGKRLSRRPT